MTGQPEITHKRVLKVAIPVVLSNATVPILGAVDVGVVGQMGEAIPIGAVAMGAIILSTVYWIFGFLRMGTAGLVGQAEGAEDHAEVSAILSRALLIAGGGGLLLILLQIPIFAVAFVLTALMLLTTRSKQLDMLEAKIDVEKVEEETLTRAPRH